MNAHEHPLQATTDSTAAKLDLSGPIKIYPATRFVGETSRRALHDATAWVISQQSGE